MKTVDAIHANRGIESRYRKAIQDRINQMNASIEYWMAAAYKLHFGTGRPDLIQRAIRDLAERWIGRFEDAAPKIAGAYVKGAFKASDSAFMNALRKAGWAVEFKMTPNMNAAFHDVLDENIMLIKSIPAEYLPKVETALIESYTAGRDLESMVKTLRRLYPQASNRAELIARDQMNKANSVVNRARMMEVGITEALWLHSHGGKEPRPDHLAADRKRYNIAEGCLISGEYIQPGEMINCRCTCRAVLPEQGKYAENGV